MHNDRSILIPRRIEERQKRFQQVEYQRLQNYKRGDLDLFGSPITKLPDNLTEVHGDFIISNSKINDLNNITYVRNLCADYEQLLNLRYKDNITIFSIDVFDLCMYINVNSLIWYERNKKREQMINEIYKLFKKCGNPTIC